MVKCLFGGSVPLTHSDDCDPRSGTGYPQNVRPGRIDRKYLVHWPSAFTLVLVEFGPLQIPRTPPDAPGLVPRGYDASRLI